MCSRYHPADNPGVNPLVGSCLGPCGGPKGGVVSHERGTPVASVASSLPQEKKKEKDSLREEGLGEPRAHASESTLETTKGQTDGFSSQLPFKCYLPEVTSVGDGLKICPWAATLQGGRGVMHLPLLFRGFMVVG